MPYLQSKIEKHNDGCKKSSAKRLYIRDYDNKGKQTFIPYGMTCTSCGVIQTEKYSQNLTPTERKKQQVYEMKYTQEQRKAFDDIDMHYFVDTFAHHLDGHKKARGESIREWGRKLREAGMPDNDIASHIGEAFKAK